MSHQLSFTERFNTMIGIAVQRLGYLGKPSYYSGPSYNTDAYRVFGLKTPPRFLEAIPSLTDARCPACLGVCEVRDVQDNTFGTFAGTFAESEDSHTVAQGTLVCATDAQHTSNLPYGTCTVSVASLVSELICVLDDIATELGY